MTLPRHWLLALLGWLFVLSGLGHLHGSFRPSLAVQGFAFLIAVLPFAWAAVGRLSRLVYVGSVLAAFGVLKTGAFGWHGELLFYPTLVEGGLVLGTAILALGCARQWGDLQNLLAELTRLSLPHRYPDFSTAEEDMERELRRARRYERPLSLVTVQTPEIPNLDSPELWASVREHLTRQYGLSRLAEILHNETKTTDLVSYVDGRFVLLLPETQKDAALRLADRLTKRVRQVLSADLQTGIASFPSEEITIFGLMERSQTSCDSQDREEFRNLEPAEEPVAEMV